VMLTGVSAYGIIEGKPREDGCCSERSRAVPQVRDHSVSLGAVEIGVMTSVNE
jgi:hypothetical protein